MHPLPLCLYTSFILQLNAVRATENALNININYFNFYTLQKEKLFKNLCVTFILFIASGNY